MRLHRPLVLALALATAPAIAGDFDFQVGASQSAHQGGTPTVWVQTVVLSETLGQSGRWQREPLGTVGWVDGRDANGYRGSTWLIGIGQRVRHVRADGQPSPWFIEGNLVGAVGRTDALSGPLQFATAIGWSGERYQVLVRHVSNAGLREPNRGETMLLLGVSF